VPVVALFENSICEMQRAASSPCREAERFIVGRPEIEDGVVEK
jgi:hypothetical protein